MNSESKLLEKYPYLADLAEFEWKINQSFHAFLEPPFDASVLQSADEKELERMKIIFQPSVKLVNSNWPVLDIWQCRMNKDRKELDKINLQHNPQKILIGRRDTQIRTEILDINQYHLLQSLLQGQCLSDACETLDASGDEELPVAEWFSGWVRDGLISCVELKRTFSPADSDR